MHNQISGVFAAVPTAFDESDKINLDLFLEHCEWVFDNGGNGLNVLGTTGEANSLSRQSREELMRATAKSDLGRRALMVGTGTPSLSETCYLTILAAELQFDAALVLPPFYYKPVSDDALFVYIARVIKSIATTDIGIYLYNFPQMTGIRFSEELIARLIEAFPNHLKGMKDSSGDMAYAQTMANEFQGVFDIFPSSETCLSTARTDGYAGCISASVNATVGLASSVWREQESSAQKDIDELRQLRTDIASVPIVSAVKTLVSLRTGHSEWLRMLPPLMELDASARVNIESIANQLAIKTT